MRPDLAPEHVARIKELAREGFYDGIVFHRVIEGFMAQTGDPTGTGMGGSGRNCRPSFRPNLCPRHHRHGAPRTRTAATANFSFASRIAVPQRPIHRLGQVTEGMELVDGITRGEPPANPDAIKRLQVAADASNGGSIVTILSPADAASSGWH